MPTGKDVVRVAAVCLVVGVSFAGIVALLGAYMHNNEIIRSIIVLLFTPVFLLLFVFPGSTETMHATSELTIYITGIVFYSFCAGLIQLWRIKRKSKHLSSL